MVSTPEHNALDVSSIDRIYKALGEIHCGIADFDVYVNEMLDSGNFDSIQLLSVANRLDYLAAQFRNQWQDVSKTDNMPPAKRCDMPSRKPIESPSQVPAQYHTWSKATRERISDLKTRLTRTETTGDVLMDNSQHPRSLPKNEEARLTAVEGGSIYAMNDLAFQFEHPEEYKSYQVEIQAGLQLAATRIRNQNREKAEFKGLFEATQTRLGYLPPHVQRSNADLADKEALIQTSRAELDYFESHMQSHIQSHVESVIRLDNRPGVLQPVTQSAAVGQPHSPFDSTQTPVRPIADSDGIPPVATQYSFRPEMRASTEAVHNSDKYIEADLKEAKETVVRIKNIEALLQKALEERTIARNPAGGSPVNRGTVAKWELTIKSKRVELQRAKLCLEFIEARLNCHMNTKGLRGGYLIAQAEESLKGRAFMSSRAPFSRPMEHGQILPRLALPECDLGLAVNRVNNIQKTNKRGEGNHAQYTTLSQDHGAPQIGFGMSKEMKSLPEITAAARKLPTRETIGRVCPPDVARKLGEHWKQLQPTVSRTTDETPFKRQIPRAEHLRPMLFNRRFVQVRQGSPSSMPGAYPEEVCDSHIHPTLRTKMEGPEFVQTKYKYPVQDTVSNHISIPADGTGVSIQTSTQDFLSYLALQTYPAHALSAGTTDTPKRSTGDTHPNDADLGALGFKLALRRTAAADEPFGNNTDDDMHAFTTSCTVTLATEEAAASTAPTVQTLPATEASDIPDTTEANSHIALADILPVPTGSLITHAESLPAEVAIGYAEEITKLVEEVPELNHKIDEYSEIAKKARVEAKALLAELKGRGEAQFQALPPVVEVEIGSDGDSDNDASSWDEIGLDDGVEML
ncbi:hypothetical protein K432DRAFT_401382 [Lepidopterella palustris CBS 459.81]|uniref:Uncharacterized protein n=1 Tax=Lepidopterella palustris CBS 459.81 TaxID=1314670 RepID=A0A8E2EHN5_9PEZI|nr:hypothetical protein K432DRAFT_401382 [Lepidopterella palustris CBS 459.81]